MKNILVVDDNEMLCRMACDILNHEGYCAVPATSVEAALEAFEQQSFDLVVTSFHMPGMGGAELARAIRNRAPGFPIIMTGFEPVDCEHATLFLPRQFLFPSLLEKIGACLLESETRAQ
ncbi:MAG TPA: response regulator [Terriglobales bacterium]|nr:response regulator [Terriglobales bacterium]